MLCLFLKTERITHIDGKFFFHEKLFLKKIKVRSQFNWSTSIDGFLITIAHKRRKAVANLSAPVWAIDNCQKWMKKTAIK